MTGFPRAGLAAAAAIAVLTSPFFTASAFAEGDAAKGERVFKKCMSCHSLEEGTNKVGPTLHGLAGRAAGTVEGFRYSKINHAASEAGLVWDEQSLVDYLADPQAFLTKFLEENGGTAQGRTKMTFKLKKDSERADVAAYLMSLGN